MARPDVTGRNAIAGVPIAAYTIAEFCRAHRISQSMYFKMRNLGLGPREMAVGSRRLISAEAARAWRKTRERAATAQPGREPDASLSPDQYELNKEPPLENAHRYRS